MAKKHNGIREGTGSRVFDVVLVILMLLFAFVMIYPFWNQFVISINEGSDTVMGGLTFWPRKFTMENYQYVIEKTDLGRGAVMSILRVVVGTVTSLFCTGLVAYITTIYSFPAHRFLRIFFIVTMYFGGGMIPVYLMFRNLGLLDTFTVYWLPGLIGAYNMMLIGSYIMGLPESLAESARIDGASELRIYFRIILPLCTPVLAAVGIMVAVGHWNSWFDVVVYNSSGNFDTLQVFLRKILLQGDQAANIQSELKKMQAMKHLTPESVKAAVTMIVTIPIVCIYPFFQRYFVSGMTLGAVKA